MNEENTQKLYEAFPRLYRSRGYGLMEYGFSCGDGWFDLIYKLSADIELAAREAGLDPYSEQWPSATQIKQKNGTLRFHFHIRTLGENDFAPISTLMPTGFIELKLAAGIDAIRQLIADASEMSAGICENCGLPHRIEDCKSLE